MSGANRPKVYLASSWQNPFFDDHLKHLSVSSDVYNWKQQEFTEWTTIPHLEKGAKCTVQEFLTEFATQRTMDGFMRDKVALENADLVVLLLPCGLSAHMEAAYAAGQGKPVIVLAPEGVMVPELMYGLLSSRGLSSIFPPIFQREINHG